MQLLHVHIVGEPAVCAPPQDKNPGEKQAEATEKFKEVGGGC